MLIEKKCPKQISFFIGRIEAENEYYTNMILNDDHVITVQVVDDKKNKEWKKLYLAQKNELNLDDFQKP